MLAKSYVADIGNSEKFADSHKSGLFDFLLQYLHYLHYCLLFDFLHYFI